MDHLSAVRQGLKTVRAEPDKIEQALRHVEQWLTADEFHAYQPQLSAMIEAGQWSLLLDSFYQVIPFGTGGRRGTVGIGPNRLNPWTVANSVQGHAVYLRQRFPEAELQVVIGFDVRQFLDTKGVYRSDLPNPLLGLSSRDFARIAAGVYAANGVTVWILPADSPRYLSTPELSFIIRLIGAHGGLNITASHNPPDDNGTKFYTELGSQPVPPEDQLISEYVEAVTEVRTVDWNEAVRQGKIRFLDDGSHEEFLELCRKQSLVPPPTLDELRVVYTPLHGVGRFGTGEILERQGFRLIHVESQYTPDGRFPNVTGTPNPERPDSLDRAERLASENQADLIIATDPDADRLGGMACQSPDGKGEYAYLNGNQIAALLTYFKLSRLASAGDLPPSPIVITTEVTTGQITRIARHFGCQIVNDLLVGFKYHADVLHQLETHGQFGDVFGTAEDFVIATEESHGILATAEIRDKDATCAALLLAELALHLKRQGRTIPELLVELSRQFGYFCNRLHTVSLPGLEGKELMVRMLNSVRSDPPATIAGLPISTILDQLDEAGKRGPIKGETDRASRNFLTYLSEPTPEGFVAKVSLRPSGTEPTAKIYVEVATPPCPVGTPDDTWNTICANADQLAEKCGNDFLRQALARVGREPG